MPKLPAAVAMPSVALDLTSDVPLYRQLYDALRDAILAGQLTAGTRLPATRVLAASCEVSRNTVVSAFEQLLAEGYLEGRVGDGTYVSQSLPDELLQVRAAPTPLQRRAQRGDLSQRGALMTRTRVASPRAEGSPQAFRPGTPAFDVFPFEVWGRLASRRWREPAYELFSYGDPAGYRPLREAIAAYLGPARGVRCSADQVIIVNGSQQGIDLAARVLADPDDLVWIEDPGYLGARAALIGAGLRLIPVPVDHEGIDVAAGLARCAGARLAYVSPSHQFPLGVTMSLARRLALLEWAQRMGAWVLEDDYDSEYRYAGRPLAALQGLDREGRVIYIGTLSKVLFPGLRLGYLVVPPDLVDAFVNVRALTDRHGPLFEQAVLADFMVEGHLARHIRRMRALYAERRALLIELAQRYLAGMLEICPPEAGMHTVGWLPPGVDDLTASRCAAANGVDVPALSLYYQLSPARNGLLLGYAGVAEAEIHTGVQGLTRALRGIGNRK
jgi:GntR family transcriptional regulator/MocR family aminotransferase